MAQETYEQPIIRLDTLDSNLSVFFIWACAWSTSKCVTISLALVGAILADFPIFLKNRGADLCKHRRWPAVKHRDLRITCETKRPPEGTKPPPLPPPSSVVDIKLARHSRLCTYIYIYIYLLIYDSTFCRRTLLYLRRPVLFFISSAAPSVTVVINHNFKVAARATRTSRQCAKCSTKCVQTGLNLHACNFVAAAKIR